MTPRRSRSSVPALALALSAGLAVVPAAAQNAQTTGGARAAEWRARPADTLPIRTITLYRSGVGSFERRGPITGEQTVQLRFSVEQINDILKSMVVLDSGDGEIESVAYGSKDPLGRRLASFGLDVRGVQSMPDLLSSLRGTPVTLTTGEGAISGKVLGVETRPESGGAPGVPPIMATYVNLAADGFRSVRLSDVRALRVDDPALAGDIDKALAAIAEERTDRIKTVDITSRGTGQRDLIVAYVHETPVWKTSYRVILPEGDGAASGEARVQGWAIVENTTDEDWQDVRLSLVAGEPVGFTMDLYEPVYGSRPEVPVPVAAGVGPRVYEMAASGFADAENLTAQIAAESAEKLSGRGESRADMIYENRIGGRAPGAPAAMPAPASAAAFGRGAAARASGESSGEVFQYVLSSPVSIARQRSAMLPIVNTPAKARRVSIFRPGVDEKHPMRGVELVNTTDLQFMPGPVSVFDGATYAGDAQIGHIPAGDKRLLAFATDLEVLAVTDTRQSDTITRTRIVRGVLEHSVRSVHTTTLTLTNKDKARPRTVIVEVARMPGMELEEVKASETTPNLHRFEVTLKPDQTGTLKVPQASATTNNFTITSLDTPTLLRITTQGKPSPATLEAVRSIAAKRESVDAARRAEEALNTQIAEITGDQDRLRQNMGAIDRASQLYAQYLQKLTMQESTLDDLRAKLKEARATTARLQSELDDAVSKLTTE